MQQKPFAIAIAGGSGSGKTTLARHLQASLTEARCALLEHDSYYRDLAHLPAAARSANNFDHPDSLESSLLAEHVRALRAGKSIERPEYDFVTHTRKAGSERVQPRPVLLCEGILLLAAPELRSTFDLRVFVDTPADVRALRRLERDIVERGRSITSVMRQYFATVRPMHEAYVAPSRRSADIVIDWRTPLAEQAEQVQRAIDDEGHRGEQHGEPLR
ncbi:MAG: uridine kinase [Planctomycetota bacterium]